MSFASVTIPRGKRFALKSLKRNLRRLLPSTVKGSIGFTGKKLNNIFRLRTTKSEQKCDIVYLGTCPEENRSDNYINKRAHRFFERIIDHSSRDQNAHIFKDSCENATNTSH